MESQLHGTVYSHPGCLTAHQPQTCPVSLGPKAKYTRKSTYNQSKVKPTRTKSKSWHLQWDKRQQIEQNVDKRCKVKMCFFFLDGWMDGTEAKFKIQIYYKMSTNQTDSPTGPNKYKNSNRWTQNALAESASRDNTKYTRHSETQVTHIRAGQVIHKEGDAGGSKTHTWGRKAFQNNTESSPNNQ